MEQDSAIAQIRDRNVSTYFQILGDIYKSIHRSRLLLPETRGQIIVRSDLAS